MSCCPCSFFCGDSIRKTDSMLPSAADDSCYQSTVSQPLDNDNGSTASLIPSRMTSTTTRVTTQSGSAKQRTKPNWWFYRRDASSVLQVAKYGKKIITSPQEACTFDVVELLQKSMCQLQCGLDVQKQIRLEAESSLLGQYTLAVRGNVKMAKGSVVDVRTLGTQPSVVLADSRKHFRLQIST